MNSAQPIRSAFASEEFEAAHRLWDEYASDIEKMISSGQASDHILAEARELIGWTRRFVLSFHAHSAARLAAARVAEIYTHTQDSSANLVRTRL